MWCLGEQVKPVCAGGRQAAGARGQGPFRGGSQAGSLSTGPEQVGPQGLTPAALLPLWGHVAPDAAVPSGLGTHFEVPLCPNPQQALGHWPRGTRSWPEEVDMGPAVFRAVHHLCAQIFSGCADSFSVCVSGCVCV